MSLSQSEVDAFRQKATAHNATIREQMRADVAVILSAADSLIARATKLVVADVDDNLRLRDVTLNACQNLKANLEQVVVPILNPANMPTNGENAP